MEKKPMEEELLALARKIRKARRTPEQIEAFAKQARENGRRGGRPRKEAKA